MTTAIANVSTAEPSPSSNHPIVSRNQWLAERKKLLAREKELTHLGDQVARERRALPWVRIEQGLCLRQAGRPAAAGRSVRRPPPARRAALHARAGLGGGLQELLLHGRPHRRHDSRIWRSATSPSLRSRARRSARSSASAGAWAGSSSGCPRTATASTTTSASASRRRRVAERQDRLQFRQHAAGRGDAGRQRVLEGRRGRRSSTPIRPTAAAWR